MTKGNPVPLVNDWLDDSLKWEALLPLDLHMLLLQCDVKNFVALQVKLLQNSCLNDFHDLGLCCVSFSPILTSHSFLF